MRKVGFSTAPSGAPVQHAGCVDGVRSIRGVRSRVPFELQPTLTGDLLDLQPLRPDDFEALYAVARDPLIWEQHPASDRWTHDVFTAFFQEALDSGGAFLVIERRSGAVIGSSRYFGYDEATSEIEIGWTFLARRYWGGTYNAEMKRLMLDHAFRFVKHVVFLIGPHNLRSQKAIEKIGAVRASSRVVDKGGEPFEVLVYRITAPV
jgi:RimJ/RimL family protein N-acetyltransferase